MPKTGITRCLSRKFFLSLTLFGMLACSHRDSPTLSKHAPSDGTVGVESKSTLAESLPDAILTKPTPKAEYRRSDSLNCELNVPISAEIPNPSRVILQVLKGDMIVDSSFMTCSRTTDTAVIFDGSLKVTEPPGPYRVRAQVFRRFPVDSGVSKKQYRKSESYSKVIDIVVLEGGREKS